VGGETEVTLNRASFAELQAVVGGKTGAERILGRGLRWERLDSEPSGRGLDIVALSEALSPFALSAEAVIRREELAAVGPMRLDSESYIKVYFCWCEAWFKLVAPDAVGDCARDCGGSFSTHADLKQRVPGLRLQTLRKLRRAFPDPALRAEPDRGRGLRRPLMRRGVGRDA
jgi:hypothetical protein